MLNTLASVCFTQRIKRVVLLLAASLQISCQSGTYSNISEQQANARRDVQRLNVLWIIAEDMGQDWGIHGTAASHTPNLDNLAQQGMQFNNVFTTTPVCSTSRSSIFTGMYATSLGAHHHRLAKAFRPELPEGVELITHTLEKAGYQTGLITKLGGAGINGKPVKGSGKTDWNFLYQGKPYQTKKLSELSADRPFFAQVQFGESHRPFKQPEDVPYPTDPTAVNPPPYYADHPVIRKDWADYLNSVQMFDAKVQYTLDQFAQRGLLKNTVVFIFTDHGRAHFRDKQWVYDSGVKIPLIILWPEGHTAPAGYQAHGTSEQLLSAIDISVQTLAIAGAEISPVLQGKPFFGETAQTRDYVISARDRMGEAVDYIRSVRTKQFRYIKNYMPDIPYAQFSSYKELSYPAQPLMRGMYQKGQLTPAQAAFFKPQKPAEELYDIIQDPFEINNLAKDPAYQDKLAELRHILLNWQQETADKGQIPESQASFDASTGYSEGTKQQIRQKMQSPDWSYKGKIPLLDQ